MVFGKLPDGTTLGADGILYARMTDGYNASEGYNRMAMMVWNTSSLAWEKYTGSGGAGGGGDASAANQASEITLLTAISGKFGSLGQKTMAGSAPVTLASDQSAVPVSGSVTATGPLTDTQLRATPVPVSGSVTASGPVTDTQLRATPVPVSGPLTDTQLRATPVPVSGSVTASGPLTDTQLRATPVPVSGSVTASGPLTDTQLRATPVPVSASALPLPSGAATEATLATVPIAQSVALGTNKQVMAGAAVSTGVPAYTDGLVSPLSQTPDGRLRVDSVELRRQAEISFLAAVEVNLRNLAALEPSSSERRGYEIR